MGWGIEPDGDKVNVASMQCCQMLQDVARSGNPGCSTSPDWAGNLVQTGKTASMDSGVVEDVKTYDW